VEVHLGDVRPARHLGELGGAAAEEHRSIGLWHIQRASEPENAREDGHQAFDPAPTFGFTLSFVLITETVSQGEISGKMTYQEAADDGTDGGTEEGGHGKDTCREPTF
jgi:hypothetical protein